MNKQIKKKRYWIKALRKKCPYWQLLKEMTMKNEKFQKVDIRRSLNKKGQNEKGKC